jgi:hypothetical protein
MSITESGYKKLVLCEKCDIIRSEIKNLLRKLEAIEKELKEGKTE